MKIVFSYFNKCLKFLIIGKALNQESGPLFSFCFNHSVTLSMSLSGSLSLSFLKRTVAGWEVDNTGFQSFCH